MKKVDPIFSLSTIYYLLSTILLWSADSPYRIGPFQENEGRWVVPGNEPFMILVPKNWKILTPEQTEEILHLEVATLPAAILRLRRFSDPGEQAQQTAAEHLENLKNSQPPLQQAKSLLPNGIEIRYLIYLDKIEGIFAYTEKDAYSFTAVPSGQADWNSIRNILGSLAEINEAAFRETKIESRALAAGQWVAAIDNSWMVQVAKEGWELKPPQNNDILMLVRNRDNTFLSLGVTKDPANSPAAEERLRALARQMAAQDQAISTMELANNLIFRYVKNPNQTELTGHFQYAGINHTVNVYGQPNIDYEEIRKILGSLNPVNPHLIESALVQSPAAQDNLPAPPDSPEMAQSPEDLMRPPPALDPRVKKIFDKYGRLLVAAMLAGLIGFLIFGSINDLKLLRYGETFADRAEETKLELFGGGRYLTIFPTFVVFAPGGLKVTAVHRKPPVLQALVVIYILRWFALYQGFSQNILIALSAVLTILAVLLGITLGWSLRGTPCWIYDDSGQIISKIRRQLGFFAYRFVVFDGDRQILGYLKMSSLSNFYRKQWWILDKEHRVMGQIIEDSVFKSVIRRFLGHLWGILRADYEITSDRIKIGKIKSTRSPFNRIALTANCPPELDPRLVFSCAVALNIFNRDRWYPFWSS
ncbi:MAG: hypothetical protein HY401_05400 [Elusimicrobia bacterium]|nr:hypothetical protein [Elusimicrobiota bacterium]